MRIMQCVLKSATRLCKNSDTLGNDWFTTTHTVRTLSGAFYVLQLRDLVCIFFTFGKQHSKLHIFSQDSLSPLTVVVSKTSSRAQIESQQCSALWKRASRQKSRFGAHPTR